MLGADRNRPCWEQLEDLDDQAEDCRTGVTYARFYSRFLALQMKAALSCNPLKLYSKIRRSKCSV